MGNFMQKEITGLCGWWEIDGTDGMWYFPDDMFSFGQSLEQYPGEADREASCHRIGHGARLSAPGYLDCTDWSVFGTPEEADEYLDEMYGDDEPGDDNE